MKNFFIALVFITIASTRSQEPDVDRMPAYEDAEYRSEQIEMELKIRALKREIKQLKQEKNSVCKQD